MCKSPEISSEQAEQKSGRNLKEFPVQFDFSDFSFFPSMGLKLKKGGRFLQFDCILSRKYKVRITEELRKIDFYQFIFVYFSQYHC